MWQTHDMGSGWWLVMVMLLVALGVFIALVLIDRRSDGRPDSGSTRAAPVESPREILDRRLAAGEITIEEYESRKRALGAGREHTAA